MLPFVRDAWNEPTRYCFFFSSRRRHTRSYGDWSSDVCSSDLLRPTTISLIQVVVPAEAILIGTLWLGEPVSIRMLAGAALVVAAVALNAVAGSGTRPAEERLAATPAAGD